MPSVGFYFFFRREKKTKLHMCCDSHGIYGLQSVQVKPHFMNMLVVVLYSVALLSPRHVKVFFALESGIRIA